MSWKNAPKLDFQTMKYAWFLNTSREFKVRRKRLVFGSNYLPIPTTQIYQKKKHELASALFRSEVLLLILGALISAIFEVVGRLYSFANFLENKSRSKQKTYTTFINSSWVIFKRNMRVVIFWTMCHHSLGHEKKALLILGSSLLDRSSLYP